eukprot:13350374-Alexandrium_andersonii.AAC.1
MGAERRAAIEEGLGLTTDVARTWRIDTGERSPFPHGRLFFSTLPAPDRRFRPRPAQTPWEPGWRPRGTR